MQRFFENKSNFFRRAFSILAAMQFLICKNHRQVIDGDFPKIYLKDGAWVSPVANVSGPGFDMEKYILAALVVPKSRLEPVS